MAVEVKNQQSQQVEQLRNESMSPSEKLAAFRDLRACTQNEHGFGFHTKSDGSSVLVFADLEHKSLVTVPTKISRSDFEKIANSVLAIPETQYMMYELGLAYANRTPIMFEGGTGIGKTFVVNHFAQLLYGPATVIPDLYCNGQTDVSELMGKYVPSGLSATQVKQLDEFLKSDAGAALKAEMFKPRGTVDWAQLTERAAIALGFPIQKGSFAFQLGILPKAMTGTMAPNGAMLETPDGPGTLLHLQEVGMAPPAILNALFKIRGEKGKLAPSIQLHEDGGRLVEAGEGFFLVMSTNPPGKGFKERFDVDCALSRALVWKRLPDELSESSLQLVAKKIFDFTRVERNPDSAGAILDLRTTPELAQRLGDVAMKFHRVFGEKLDTGEPGRRQRIPVTIDSLWKVAEILQNHQVPKGDFSGVDVLATLKSAVQGHYIDALQDKPFLITPTKLSDAAKATTSLGATLLGSLNEILTNRSLHTIEFRDEQRTYEEIIKILETEAFAPTEADTAADLAAAAAEEAALRDQLQLSAALQSLVGAMGTAAVQKLVGEIGTKATQKAKEMLDGV